MKAATRRFLPTYLLLGLMLACQLGFWWQTRGMLPNMEVVPDVPGRQTVKALSLGDEQFYFRVLALEIQNSGDTFGRFTALYKYDFKKLYAWFKLLDALDDRSNIVPTMATYYFSQTQHVPDVRYIVDYLYEHSAARVEQKWWWLVQAIYLASHKLEDEDLALKVAQPLTSTTKIPVWAQQMPAFVHEKRGEMEDALAIMENIKHSQQEIKPGELNFMRYFVLERLSTLEKAQASDIAKQPKYEIPAGPAKPEAKAIPKI